MAIQPDTVQKESRSGDCLSHRYIRHETDRLYLETLSDENMSASYVDWLQDPEVVKYLEVRHASRSEPSIRQFVQEMLASNDSLLLGIFLKKGRRHIGNIKIGPVDWRYRRGDIGLVIGDKTCWGKGYGSEAIDGICQIAFQTLALRRVEAGAYASNKGSIKAFLKANFTSEGVRRCQWILDGQAEDHVILGRLAQQA